MQLAADVVNANRYGYAQDDPLNFVDPSGGVPRQQGAGYGGSGGGAGKSSRVGRVRASGTSAYYSLLTQYIRVTLAIERVSNKYPGYASILREIRDDIIDRLWGPGSG